MQALWRRKDRSLTSRDRFNAKCYSSVDVALDMGWVGYGTISQWLAVWNQLATAMIIIERL